MKILIAAVGRATRGPEQELVEKYLKRIPWDIAIKEVAEKRSLPDSKKKESESRKLLSLIPKSSKKIVLDQSGKKLSSLDFSEKIRSWQNQGCSRISFLIGGADGHDKQMKNQADFILSLGDMTWPHMLVRVLIAEQLYRTYSILSSHPYHRE